MYLKSINNFQSTEIPFNLKLHKGSIISGLPMLLDDESLVVRLFDGSVLPAILLDDNFVESHKFCRFQIIEFDNDRVVLKTIQEKDTTDTNTILNISKELNIPYEKSKEIVYNLIKFNLPVTDKNILTLYKNIKFIDELNNLTPMDIQSLIQNHSSNNIDNNSIEFKIGKEIIGLLKNMDIDFFTFMLENDIPITVDNIINLNDFLNKDNLTTDIIKKFNLLAQNDEININIDEWNFDFSSEEIYTPLETNEAFNSNSIFEPNKTHSENQLFGANILTDQNENEVFVKLEDYFKSFVEIINKNKVSKSNNMEHESKLSFVSLDEVFEEIQNNPKVLSSFPAEFIKNLSDSIDILNKIYNNYNLYFFNTLTNELKFKNRIIIKNKFKSADYINTDEAKIYISVDTPSFGVVEGFIYKQNKSLYINIKTPNDVQLFKTNSKLLVNSLKECGYENVNITVEKLVVTAPINFCPNFFNDINFKALDVKV